MAHAYTSYASIPVTGCLRFCRLRLGWPIPGMAYRFADRREGETSDLQLRQTRLHHVNDMVEVTIATAYQAEWLR